MLPNTMGMIYGGKIETFAKSVIQDASGNRPAMQISDCASWNVQHPKWFPPRNDGKVFLIAAVQATSGGPFRIASFDVTAFVTGN